MGLSRPRRYTRRELLQLASAAALVSCTRGPTPEEVAAEAALYSRELHCMDTAGLFPAEIATRKKNEYTERSEDPLRYCFNCQYFKPAAKPDRCGSCPNVPGPIHPLGHCTAWTAKR